MVNSRVPALLVAAYLLIITAWIFSNPPGSAPDEGAHYLKAFAAGRGDLILEQRPPAPDPNAEPKKPLAWMHQQARTVSLPARLSPEAFGCRGEPARVAPCTFKPANPAEEVEISTYVATYPPASYVLPGLLMRAADTTHEALYLGRTGSGLVSALLLVLGLSVLWSKRGWLSLFGLIAAISPMVVFVSSSLSSSGVEAAAGICFMAGLMRLTRQAPSEDQKADTEGGRATGTGFVWTVLGLSGVLLALTRDLGLVWVGVLVLIYLAWAGVRTAWRTLEEGGRAAWIAVALLAVSGAMSLAWQLFVQIRPSLSLGALKGELSLSWGFLKEITRQQIGIFGPLDTVMIPWAYRAWWILAGAMIAGALVAGDMRRRAVLLATIVGTIAITLVLDAAQRLVGFGAQGRHVLPLATAVILMSGEIIFQKTEKSARIIPAGVALVASGIVAGVQLLAWHTVARRYSVGLSGPRIFFQDAVWAPPMGWPFWTALALVGTGLIFLAGLAAIFGSPPSLRSLRPALARRPPGELDTP